MFMEKTFIVFAKGYLTSLEGDSDIPTKNNEYILHIHIEHKFVVVFITVTYYTFDVDLMDFW